MLVGWHDNVAPNMTVFAGLYNAWTLLNSLMEEFERRAERNASQLRALFR